MKHNISNGNEKVIRISDINVPLLSGIEAEKENNL